MPLKGGKVFFEVDRFPEGGSATASTVAALAIAPYWEQPQNPKTSPTKPQNRVITGKRMLDP
jgi:hypothetical protein